MVRVRAPESRVALNGWNRRRRTGLAWAGALAIAAGSTTGASAKPVMLRPVRSFAIAAQPLASALLQLSRQADVDIVASERVTRGYAAPAVHGIMPAQEALSRLLAQSGLRYRQGADGRFIVEQPKSPPPAPQPLPPRAARRSEPGPEPISDIIVNAQRRAEALQSVPIAVTAFGQNMLRDLNIRTTDQLQFATPGLINSATAGDGISTAYIRGVGTGYSGPGLEGSVAVYLDDVYLQSQTSSAQAIVDIAQIQILKGPQGTLYGRNATGGAIVLTTADPKLDRAEGYAKAGYGNLGWKRIEAVVNLPLGPTFAARAAGFFENRDGYVKNVAIPGLQKSGVGAGETYSGRLKLLWQPVEDFTAIAKVQYDRRDGNGAVHNLRYTSAGVKTDLGWYETAQSPNREGGGGEDTSALAASLHVEYRAGDWTISDTLGHRRTRSYGCTDNDGLPEESLYFCVVSQRSPNPGHAHGKQDNTLTNELRVVSDTSGPLNMTMGLFFERNRASFVGRIGGTSLGTLTPTFDNRDRLTSYAGFLELYYQLTDRLKAIAGLRYTYERKYHARLLDADGVAFLGGAVAPFGEQRTHFSNESPRFVLSYDLGSTKLHASYNRGFKSGGFNSPAPTLDPPLAPETISAFEAGANYRSPDGRSRLTAAAYRYVWKDVQVAFITGGGAGIFQQNAAGAHIWGGELNFERVSDSWRINMGLAYTHARFSSFPNAAVYNIVAGMLQVTAQDLKGVRLPQAPDLAANASITYRFPLPQGWDGSVTLAGRYSTKYDYTAGGGGVLRASRQPAYGLVNLTGSIAPPARNITFGWFVANLFSQHYISLISTGNTGVYMTPAEPRTYGVTMQYSF